MYAKQGSENNKQYWNLFLPCLLLQCMKYTYIQKPHVKQRETKTLLDTE